jgi:hypothetical protein
MPLDRDHPGGVLLHDIGVGLQHRLPFRAHLCLIEAEEKRLER